MATVSKLLVIDDIFLDNNLEHRSKYKCPLCDYLLKDAVQTSCGHWFCRDCGDTLFRKSSRPSCPRPDCGEKLEVEDGKEYFPDKFACKEIGKFQVRCLYHTNGCTWTGVLLELVKHTSTCVYEMLQCEYCHGQFEKSKLNDHIMNYPKACPFAQYGCEDTKQMTRAECDKHMKVEVAIHSKIVASLLGRISSVQFDSGKNSSSPEHSSCDVSPVESRGYRPFSAMSGSQPPLHDASQIRHLQDKLQEVESTVLAKTTENEDRDFRLSLMENSNYDGTMVWKIPQFSQRMEDARTGKYTSIFSLPFYSSRCGYKMCLHLYILGDGIGKGSHMSLFFVLMKGEFDNILRWPFTYKVTFKLINQCGGRDVMDIFQPDPLSTSFQKPKTDMNIGNCCPRFVSLNELMQNGFIIEDTIFIKVKVDTTTMKHP